MLLGPVSMGVTIFIQRPKGKKLKKEYPTHGADIMNILKGPMDEWQGLVYANDNQVINFHRLEKRWTVSQETETLSQVPGLLVDFKDMK